MGFNISLTQLASLAYDHTVSANAVATVLCGVVYIPLLAASCWLAYAFGALCCVQLGACTSTAHSLTATSSNQRHHHHHCHQPSTTATMDTIATTHLPPPIATRHSPTPTAHHPPTPTTHPHFCCVRIGAPDPPEEAREHEDRVPPAGCHHRILDLGLIV